MMRAISRALNIERLNEREYRVELASIRREIEFLLDFIEESPSHRTLSPVVGIESPKNQLLWQ